MCAGTTCTVASYISPKKQGLQGVASFAAEAIGQLDIYTVQLRHVLAWHECT